MNWTDFLADVFQLCAIPILVACAAYIVAIIKKKTSTLEKETETQLSTKYLDVLKDFVSTCVSATNQTYVEELKKSGTFTEEEKKKAFTKTYEAVMSLLTEEAKKQLAEITEDIPQLISQLIESQVQKNSDK